MSVENSYGNILNLFVRLIGYLNLILQFDSYQEDYDKYNMILSYIYKWAVLYEMERNLDFIDNNDLIAIYETADELFEREIRKIIA